MNKEILLKLISLIEVQAVGILLENNIVEYIREPKSNNISKTHNNFTNIKITEKYRDILDIEEYVTDEWVKEFRNLFPKDRQGDLSVIKQKAERFILANPTLNLNDIHQIVKAYIESEMFKNGGQWIFKASNIFYVNRLAGGRTYTESPILNVIEQYGPKVNEEQVEEDQDGLGLGDFVLNPNE